MQISLSRKSRNKILETSFLYKTRRGPVHPRCWSDFAQSQDIHRPKSAGTHREDEASPRGAYLQTTGGPRNRKIRLAPSRKQDLLVHFPSPGELGGEARLLPRTFPDGLCRLGSWWGPHKRSSCVEGAQGGRPNSRMRRETSSLE